MRCVQPVGERGSLKWIQRAVNDATRSLDPLILDHLPHATRINWLSPRRGDDYAEYRDGAFVERIGRPDLKDALRAFWPARGPQWDALACTDAGHVLLVEAKAHIAEICSPATAATGASKAKIASALAETATHCRAEPLVAWTDGFYQLANRLAHLAFLRRHAVDARLVLVDFVGDGDMGGPRSPAEWAAAYQIVEHVMGFRRRHALAAYVFHVHPDVATLESPVPL